MVYCTVAINMFSFFKSAEKKKQLEEELGIRFDETLEKIIVFPGTKSEFEEFMGFKTKFVDLGNPQKGLVYWGFYSNNPFEAYTLLYQAEIIKSGTIALVNAQPFTEDGHDYYGMPVKK